MKLTKEELETISDALLGKMETYNQLKKFLPSIRLVNAVNSEIKTVEKLNNLICAELEKS